VQDLIPSLISSYGYIAILILMFLNGFISTPPSEIVLAFSGVLGAINNELILPFFIAGVIGNMIGMYIPYYLGQKIGYQWLLRGKQLIAQRGKLGAYLSQFIPEEKVILLLSKRLQEKGTYLVGVFRCLPMVRSTITSLPAGIAQISLIPFLAFTFIGVVIWACFWFGLGFFLSEQWTTYQSNISIVLIIILLLLIMILKIQATKWVKKQLNP